MNTVRSGFQKLIFHLPATFPSATTDITSGLRERGSLVRFLGHGLNRALSQCSSCVDGGLISGVEGSPQILSALQKHMLEFTQRLHTAEVERRDLRIQVCAECLLFEVLSSSVQTKYLSVRETTKS